MKQVLWPLLTRALVYPQLTLLVLAAAVSGMVQSPISVSRLGCPSTCGDIEIPYPFGIGDDCAFPSLDDFNITCNDSFNPPKPFTSNIEIVNISLEAGVMRVFTPISYICYNSSNTTESEGEDDSWSLSALPCLISPTSNEFTAIGCDTVALLAGKEDWSYYTGCITSCLSVDEAAKDGEECAGLGCCNTPILANLSTIEVYWQTGNTTANNSAWEYSPCSYAFVAEKSWYKFSRRDLIREGNNSFLNRVGDETVPLILDWAIRKNGSCGDSTGNLTAPACISAHSFCDNTTNGDGYLCKCKEGYVGNPYVPGPGGCTNINECELLKSDPAKYGKYHCGSSSTCHDVEGDYICKCKFGHKGDGRSDKGCHPIFPGYVTAIIAQLLLALGS